RLAQQPGTSLSLLACPTNPGGKGNASCPIFRAALAVQAASGDTFALHVDRNNIDQGLWQDVCAASGSGCSGAISFGKRLISAPLEVGGGSAVIAQADYNLSLAAVASGSGTGSPDTLLFVGVSDLYRCSLNAGCGLRDTTNATNGCAAPAGVAGAQHAIAALATASLPLVYVGNDGGLWRSTDGVNQQATPCSPDDANHFQNLNGGLGSLAEIVRFAQHPTDADTLLIGVGANGSAGTSAASSTAAWGQLSAGEGGTVAIDPVNPQNWYVSTAAGVSIRQCANGAACTAADFKGVPTIGFAQVANDASLIDPPWLLDPALSSDVLIGTCRVWRGPASNGASWSGGNAISAMFGGSQNSACAGTNPVVRSLAAGGPASGAAAAQSAGSTILYAGMAGTLDGGGSVAGHLFSTMAAQVAGSSTAWTDLSNSTVTNGGGLFNPNRFDLSSIVVDSHDVSGKTVYATMMGFGSAHLYRSIDAGAHWTNISSNLPNAPANSVAIDPNDANTLYVALDTGVYVTSQVTNCTTANCWSVYGVGLPNAPVVQLAASGAMTTGDGRFGELRAGTYGRGIWQLPLLTAASTLQSAMSLSSTSLSFSSQAVGTASTPQTITVTNTGDAPLVVSSLAIAGGAGIPIAPAEQDFNETDTCTAGPVAVNASCTVAVTFLPIATGTRPGVLTLFGNVLGGQATVALSGNGTPAASIVLNPFTLSYSGTVVGATSAAANITISNMGGAPATLLTPVVTGDFRITLNTCGATLNAGSGCTVAIVFAPTTSGTRYGTLTVTDSVGTQTVSLTGFGTAPATDALSPLNLVFAIQQLNTASAAQQVTLTNSGDVALTLISAQITSGDFIVSNSCGNSLNGHSACSVAVSYVPKNVGNEAGTLTISDQYQSQTVALSGFGVAPPGVSLAPLSGMSFAPLGVGIMSAAQTVTLTNNGGLPLSLRSLSLTGDFVIVPGSNTCGTGLAANTACTLQIAFVPSAAGMRTGLLTATDDAVSSPQTLALAGTGVDFTLIAGSSSATVASGKSAVYSLLLNSITGVPGTAVFTCSGMPANATCLIVPGTVQLGTGTVLVTVTVATGVSSASLAMKRRTVWIAFVLPLVFGIAGWTRRSAFARLLGLIVLCGLFAASGCGSSRLIPGSTSTTTGLPVTPTPSGTSTIVVSASSAGLVRTVDLNLIVQ
ncbi:MAG: choice-of-anchor D domain-containing protein, partial [Granulicella sp.]